MSPISIACAFMGLVWSGITYVEWRTGGWRAASIPVALVALLLTVAVI